MTLRIHQEMMTTPIGGGTSFYPDSPNIFANVLDALKRFDHSWTGKDKAILTTQLPVESDPNRLSEHFETWFCAMIAHNRAKLGQDSITMARLESHFKPDDFPIIIDQGKDHYPTFPPAASSMAHLLGGTGANQDHVNSAMNFIHEMGLEPLNYGIGHNRLNRLFELLVPHETGRLTITDQLSRNFASTLMHTTTLSWLKRNSGKSLSERIAEISKSLMRDIPYRHKGIRTGEIKVGDDSAVSPTLLKRSLKIFEDKIPSIPSEHLFAYILGNGFHFQPVDQGNKRTFIVLANSFLVERDTKLKTPIRSMKIPDLMHGSDHKLTQIYKSIMTDGPQHELISEALVLQLSDHLKSLRQVTLEEYCASIATDGLTKVK